MVWYSHLFQNFPQLSVIHTVKDFGIVNKAEKDVFLELLNYYLIYNYLGAPLYISLVSCHVLPIRITAPMIISFILCCKSFMIANSSKSGLLLYYMV